MPQHRTELKLRTDALAIWQAGVDAVRPETLVAAAAAHDGRKLRLADQLVDLSSIDQIVVVGAGKAGAGMAAELEARLGTQLMEEKQLSGWVNVPADCVRPLARIHLHAARPAAANEPRSEGVEGAEQMLAMVAALGPRDLCIALVSGGGSALLPAPREGITLDDKLAVTRHLSAAGANIAELNTVRKQLSRIKGGGLARACGAGRLVALVISDVIGDPLDLIASGPTVPDASTPDDALEVLDRYASREAGIAARVFEVLEAARGERRASPHPGVTTRVIGNLEVAVAAAAEEARRRGYVPETAVARELEGPAEDVGRQLAERACSLRAARQAAAEQSSLKPGGQRVDTAPSAALPAAAPPGASREPAAVDCLITGGEPIVRLVPAEQRGLGGRNQQLVLAATVALWDDAGAGLALLSAGTDGEDGPTDAAGALVDEAVIERARGLGLAPEGYLRRNDAYHFFEAAGGLVKTGPTGTNVCDVRVVVVG